MPLRQQVHLCAPRIGDPLIPQLHVDVCWCSSSTVVDVPVLMRGLGLQSRTRSCTWPLRPTTGALALQYRKLWSFRSCMSMSCSSSTIVDVPVLMQRRVTGPSCCNDRVVGPDSAEHCLEVYRCRCKLYRRLEIPWCSSVMVVDTPVVCKRQVLCFDSAENCGSTASAVL